MVQLQDTHCSKLSSRSSSVFSFVRTLTPFCNLPPDGSPPENSRFLEKFNFIHHLNRNPQGILNNLISIFIYKDIFFLAIRIRSPKEFTFLIFFTIDIFKIETRNI